MGVFDRLQNYSAKSKSVTSEVFDVSTPEGYFLQKLHSLGYLMYEYYYESSITGDTLTEEKYSWLSDEEKPTYVKKMRYTELHDMLTTSGDQLVIANAGSGKALANDTKVLTSNGYKEIGKLKVHDLVYGTDLLCHEVKGVFPQGKKKVNEVTVSCNDSTFTVNVCDEHLWSDDKGNTLSTKDIKTKLSLGEIDYFKLSDFTGVKTNLLDIEKANILFKYLFLCGTNANIDTIKNLLGNVDLSLSFVTYLNSADFNTTFVLELMKVFSGSHMSVKQLDISSQSDTIAVRVTLSEDFYKMLLLGCPLHDKNTELLFNTYKPLFDSYEVDVLRVFNANKHNYKIVSIKEMETEVDMTCIEVGSDNHLFLIEHLIPTHNTTALIFKIMHDIITGEATKEVSIPNGNSVRVVDDIFVGTFLKSGAEELTERLAYWQRGMGYTVTSDRVNFSTLHAEFKRALNAMGASTPIGKTGDVAKCLKKAVENLGITRDGGVLTSEDFNIIGGIVTYYRGRLDSNKYSHPSALDYGLTPVLLDRLVSDFATQRQLAGIMDFEDLQELLYKFLYIQPNKAVQDFCANRYKYIYLDEFQDTSQIQYAILKFYARGRLWLNRGTSTSEDEESPLFSGYETLGKIIVVGDPDQTIYSWRGSDNKIIEQYFENDFRPCLSKLSYNFRCPSNILNVVIPSIKTNTGHENREYHSSREGGLARGYHFSSIRSMLNQLVIDIDEDMNEGNTVAIICRTNYDGVIPALILESDKKYDFSISGQNMTFDSPLPRKLIAVASLFTEKSSPAVKNTLSMFVSKYSQWEVKRLVDTLKTNGKSIWQIPQADIDYSCEDLSYIIKDIRSIIYENNKRVQKKEIDALKFVYRWIKMNTFGGSSLYCESARAYIDSLLYILESNDFESAFDYVDYINTLNERLHARINNQRAKISIATVHELKGKERDSVIIWNDSNGVFPSSKTDVDNLLELEEERRVHYVACTRAKKKITVYTICGKEGIFVKELALDFTSPQFLGGTLGSKKDKELSEEEQNLLNLINGELE